MTPWTLTARSLRYFWRTNLAVASGVGVAVSALSGALVVGESVRGSLRELALARLGRTDSIVVTSALFTEQQFTILRTRPALFTPPLYWRWLWRISDTIETLGKIFFRPLGGVLILEAEKQVYAAIRQPVTVRKAYSPVPATPALSR